MKSQKGKREREGFWSAPDKVFCGGRVFLSVQLEGADRNSLSLKRRLFKCNVIHVVRMLIWRLGGGPWGPLHQMGGNEREDSAGTHRPETNKPPNFCTCGCNIK